MNDFIHDMDVASMYPWSPRTIKQSEINKILKKWKSGKSHREKIQSKRRLKWYKNAWVTQDALKNAEWTKKNLSVLALPQSITDIARQDHLAIVYTGLENDEIFERTRQFCREQGIDFYRDGSFL